MVTVLLFGLWIEKETEEVQKNVTKRPWNLWYEAYLLPNNKLISSSSLDTRSKKVYCYISRRVSFVCGLIVFFVFFVRRYSIFASSYFEQKT